MSVRRVPRFGAVSIAIERAMKDNSDPSDPRVMTIREMCDAFGVTARTLRFYEAKGLISPARRGTRRLYSHRDQARLTLILKGRRLGFPLDTIGALLGLYARDEGNLHQLRAALPLAEARLAEMRDQVAGLQAAMDEIAGDIERARATLSNSKAA